MERANLKERMPDVYSRLTRLGRVESTVLRRLMRASIDNFPAHNGRPHRHARSQPQGR